MLPSDLKGAVKAASVHCTPSCGLEGGGRQAAVVSWGGASCLEASQPSDDDQCRA